jgi:hypothetical protein
MCDNPFIVHEFFCARGEGTRRDCEREQIRIVRRSAYKSRDGRGMRFSVVS